VPRYLVVVQGTFPQNVISTLAPYATFQQTSYPNGTIYYTINDDPQEVMISPEPGVLLLGSKSYLDAVLSGSLPEPVVPSSDSLLAEMQQEATAGFHLFLVINPEPRSKA